MKRDLDRLMRENGVSAIVAIGHPHNDPILYYLLNGININGWYIKKYRGGEFVLHSTIEREVAMKTGLKCINFNRYNINDIYNLHKDRIKANAIILHKVLKDLKIKGRIAFYGNAPIGYAYNLIRQLKRIDKDIEILYEPEKNMIAKARMTKNEEEVERIKKVRDGVINAFEKTIEWVKRMKVKNNFIYKERNKKLLIRDLKNNISSELFKSGFINSTGIIVAQARDAGVPHNSGRDDEPVMLGKTIVFDIFPQEIGGGYYFDFTRTICFGFAPDKIKANYELVKEAQDIAFSSIKVGKRTIEIEKKVCEHFEKHNHPTLNSNPKTQVGYCHTLGHGLGLNVHESPTFGLLKTNPDRIEKGMVFTVEPGLYYPDEGYGIRLEDVIYIDKSGRPVNLTNYPRNLLVELG
jgi:Xaa-Pro aminopeptidase|uniref:Aminopeptidase P family protein n=1 Tax=candidate division WOR-3 bacterium TaxID=2052148 RepID=A0A7V3VUA7_UNCW3